MSRLQPPLAEMSCDSQKRDDSTRDKDEKLIPLSPGMDWWNLGECLSQGDAASHSKPASGILKSGSNVLQASCIQKTKSLQLFCTKNYFSLVLSSKLDLQVLPYFLTVSETLCVNYLRKQENIAGSLDAATLEDFPFASYKFTAFASKNILLYYLHFRNILGQSRMKASFCQALYIVMGRQFPFLWIQLYSWSCTTGQHWPTGPNPSQSIHGHS